MRADRVGASLARDLGALTSTPPATADVEKMIRLAAARQISTAHPKLLKNRQVFQSQDSAQSNPVFTASLRLHLRGTEPQV